MKSPALLRIALRNVIRHRRRSLLTLCSIAFGVIAIVLSGGFIEDTLVETGESIIHANTGHLQIARAGYWEHASREGEPLQITDPEALRRTLREFDGVKDVLLRLQFTGLLGNGRSDWPIIAEGVEPKREAELGTYITLSEGRQLNATDRFGILLGKGAASALKLKVGDRATLVVSAAGGASNMLEFDVVGIFQTFSKDYDARAVRIPLESARELLSTTAAHTAVVVLQDTALTESLAGRIRQSLGQDLDLRTWFTLDTFYAKTVELYDQQFGFLVLVMIVMLVLSVSNAINVSIFERTSEFGTMMAMGNSRRDVSRLILMESVLLGLVGSVFGIVVGVILAKAISAIGIPMPPPPNADMGYTSRILVVPTVLATALVTALLSTWAASLFPGRSIRKMEIADALRAGQ